MGLFLDSPIVEHGDPSPELGSNGMYRIESRYPPRFKYTMFSGFPCVHFHCATQVDQGVAIASVCVTRAPSPTNRWPNHGRFINLFFPLFRPHVDVEVTTMPYDFSSVFLSAGESPSLPPVWQHCLSSARTTAPPVSTRKESGVLCVASSTHRSVNSGSATSSPLIFTLCPAGNLYGSIRSFKPFHPPPVGPLGPRASGFTPVDAAPAQMNEPMRCAPLSEWAAVQGSRPYITQDNTKNKLRVYRAVEHEAEVPGG